MDSFTQEESTINRKSKATATDAITRSDVTMEIQTIDIAYTVGGATISTSFNETDNVAGTATSDVDNYEVAVSFAF